MESDPVSSAADTNTGTATISAVSVSDTSNPGNASKYTISFSVSQTDGSTTYSITSDPADNTLPTNVAYTGKTDITLGGQKVTIDGTPADKDSFTVQPAASENNDIFATLDTLVNALKQTTGSPSAAGGADECVDDGGHEDQQHVQQRAVGADGGGRTRAASAIDADRDADEPDADGERYRQSDEHRSGVVDQPV